MIGRMVPAVEGICIIKITAAGSALCGKELVSERNWGAGGWIFSNSLWMQQAAFSRLTEQMPEAYMYQGMIYRDADHYRRYS